MEPRAHAIELDGHPKPWTISSLLEDGWWSGHMASHYTRVGKITLNGRLLRDEKFRTRTPLDSDTRYSKKFGEALAAARVLAFEEETGDLELSERPDIRATVSHYGTIGIEVAEVTDSAPHSAVIDDIRIEMNERVQAADVKPAACFSLWFDVNL